MEYSHNSVGAEKTGRDDQRREENKINDSLSLSADISTELGKTITIVTSLLNYCLPFEPHLLATVHSVPLPHRELSKGSWHSNP